MYYYGARYYTPEVSIWLSVDPLADKYPSMSPYMYCAGNPVRLIDPDGRGWVEGDETGVYWDKNINTQEQANDAGLTYHGQTTLQTDSKGQVWSGNENGERSPFVMMNPVEVVGEREFQVAAIEDTPDGQTMSFFFDFAFCGGGGFEIGYVTDKQGGGKWFSKGRANIGIGIGAGFNSTNIYSQGESVFTVDDYYGYSNEFNFSIGPFGYSEGGNKDKQQWKFDGFNNYGKDYIEKGSNISVLKGMKIGIWWSNTQTKPL
jgi:hypothetical protein